MYELWANKSLFRYLATDPFIDVELHGWRHERYAWMNLSDITEDFLKAISYWNEHSRFYRSEESELKRITTFLPPWNQVSLEIEQACDSCNIDLSHKKSDYIWQFHWWEVTPQDVVEVLDGGDPKSVMKRVKVR